MKHVWKLMVLVMLLGIISACTPNENEEQNDVKPIIYLYPETTQEVSVAIDYAGQLTTTYPSYGSEGWQVLAEPDGSLTIEGEDHPYSYLFWEGDIDREWSLDTGFVVSKEDSLGFLRDKLAFMGLEPKEYNEMIVYWLPILESSPYNLIYFAGTDYTETADLLISPQPDSLLRVFMVVKPLEEPMSIEEEVLEPFERNGFTVIEWGGTLIH